MLYPFKTYQMTVERHTFWVAESSRLKGCVGQGETQEEAIKELEENERVWLQVATQYAMGVPDAQIGFDS